MPDPQLPSHLQSIITLADTKLH